LARGLRAQDCATDGRRRAAGTLCAVPPVPPAVAVDGVSKTFRLPHERVHTLKERALHPFRRAGVEAFPALKDVSFAVDNGEFFGIVGRNGSGKSTLLKCLAGIYAADRGRIFVNGRLSTFIELGVGFNNDLPARDNVMINATMLGLSPREARKRYDSVIDFAELREFEDLKLKNYSSGMHVRLAFSVMIQVDAAVLLIDEVLAVGDAAFQQKCFDEFNRLRDEGRTIVLVTHDMGAVRRFCHRAMLMERGRIVNIGPPERIGSEYLDMNFAAHSIGVSAVEPVEPEDDDEAADSTPALSRSRPGEERYGDGRATIEDCWLEDERGEPLGESLPQGIDLVLKATIRFHVDMEHPSVGVGIENEDRRMVFGANTIWVNERTGVYKAGQFATMTLRFRNTFAGGQRFFISPAIAKRGTGLELADQRVRFRSFVTSAVVVTGGFVDFDYDMELRAGAQVSPRTASAA
jgi:ABC-type polysaccharide/polyol phosphate transport system ATPase subunit